MATPDAPASPLHLVEADLAVRRFAYEQTTDASTLRFPTAEARKLQGSSGALRYELRDALFSDLAGRLDSFRWQAESASFGGASLANDQAGWRLEFDRIECPRGVLLVKSATGLELRAPHASFSELRLRYQPPVSPPTATSAAPHGLIQHAVEHVMHALTAPRPTLKQGQLTLLNGLSGTLALELTVELDLPLVGKRTLNQPLHVPIVDGTLDYRALHASLNWLEGAFVDVDLRDDRLALGWSLPVVGGGKEIVSFALDHEARHIAHFGKLPLRALADYRLPPAQANARGKRDWVKSLGLANTRIQLTMATPHAVHVAGGTVLFGDEATPGLVDLQLRGALRTGQPGQLSGSVRMIDTTLANLNLGGVGLSADRLSFDDVEEFQLGFDAFTPNAVALEVHRATAINLQLTL